jgi:hypothetical protein
VAVDDDECRNLLRRHRVGQVQDGRDKQAELGAVRQTLGLNAGSRRKMAVGARFERRQRLGHEEVVTDLFTPLLHEVFGNAFHLGCGGFSRLGRDAFA